MTEADVTGIVLAAGGGVRFGQPKQFAVLAGERLVDRAVRVVTEVLGPPLLALPAGTRWDGAEVQAVVAGGDRRTESVRNALAAVDPAAKIVVVHDSARPLATPALLRRLVRAVIDGADCALPVWSFPDTLKRVGADGTIQHIGREGYVVAQTPMAFDTDMLRTVFAAFAEVPIEESIAVERLGGRVATVPGDPWSHHVVDPRDLALMERLLDGDPTWTAPDN